MKTIQRWCRAMVWSAIIPPFAFVILGYLYSAYYQLYVLLFPSLLEAGKETTSTNAVDYYFGLTIVSIIITLLMFFAILEEMFKDEDVNISQAEEKALKQQRS